jgi:cytochrome c
MSTPRLVAFILALVTGGGLLAQGARRFDVGHAPSDDDLAAWGASVFPDGKGLPPGQGSVQEGQVLYRQKCFVCHGHNARGDQAAALVGGRGSLTEARPQRTVESFWPWATTLWDYTKRAMPYEQPGSLTDDETYAIVAYVLYLGGLLEADAVLDGERLPQIEMPNRDGFIPDPRPDTGSR